MKIKMSLMHILYSTLLEEWLQLEVPWIGYAKVTEKEDNEDDEDEDEDDIEDDIEDEDEDELDDIQDDDNDSQDNESNESEEDKQQKSLWDYKWLMILVATSLFIVLLFWFFAVRDSSSGIINQGSKPINLKTSGTAVYVKFPKDEILAVLKDRNGSTHNVLMEVVLLTRDERVKAAMENNAAIILSEILELIEKQSYEHLLTFSGKQRLRAIMLKHIKKTLPDYGPSIERVLVIKFVMD